MGLIAIYAAGTAAAVLSAAGLTPVVIGAARKRGIVDLPNARKVHQVPTPRLGGLAIAGASLIGTVLVALLSRAFAGGGDDDEIGHRVITIATTAAFVLGVGVFDDL